MSDPVERLATLVERHTGIRTRDEQRSGLAAAARRALPGVEDEQALVAFQAAAPGSPLLARLVDEVTVNETYFYRAPHELLVVPWRALYEAALARGNAVVQVWVAACATGEEAYTLAMLAHEALGPAPPVSILATDISDAALQRAAAATYSDRSVATLPPELRARYVEGRGDRHTVVPTVKSLVRFARHNLVVDPLPAPGSAGFDVVTCRNVLIYFDRTTAETVVRSLRSAVMPGGQLVLGVADALAGTMSAPVSQPRRPLARRSRPSRPVRRVPAPPTPPSLAHALAAADAGDLPETIALTSEILAADTLDADAHFVLGLAELASGAPAAAVSSLRRALYLDPAFGLAAFKLGRAWDALGDDRAARRAYARALDALQSGAQSHADMLGHVDLADVADACRARLLAPADDGARIP